MTKTTPASESGIIAGLMKATMDYITSLEKRIAELEVEIEGLQNNSLPEILSISFIVDYVGVSAGTVSEWLNSGELKGMKRGGRWFIKREDFQDWLNDDIKQQSKRRLSAVK